MKTITDFCTNSTLDEGQIKQLGILAMHLAQERLISGQTLLVDKNKG